MITLEDAKADDKNKFGKTVNEDTKEELLDEGLGLSFDFMDKFNLICLHLKKIEFMTAIVAKTAVVCLILTAVVCYFFAIFCPFWAFFIVVS